MFGLKSLAKVGLGQRNALVLTARLALGSGGTLLSQFCSLSPQKKHEDYIRTLEVNAADVDTEHSPRLVASLDTGADHSLISREIVKKLNLRQQDIAQGDPGSTTLTNKKFRLPSSFCLCNWSDRLFGKKNAKTGPHTSVTPGTVKLSSQEDAKSKAIIKEDEQAAAAHFDEQRRKGDTERKVRKADKMKEENSGNQAGASGTGGTAADKVKK
ncbi:hypothetical protein E2P81_ATG09442 [Venturia nashicola]|nr:hypothetical protein E2P81_ATG09442 [Venturia nashicola]